MPGPRETRWWVPGPRETRWWVPGPRETRWWVPGPRETRWWVPNCALCIYVADVCGSILVYLEACLTSSYGSVM